MLKSALTSLKYFCEDRPDLHIMAAGSLLGLIYRNDGQDADSDDGESEGATGFPVGKVSTIPIQPMSFKGFGVPRPSGMA